MPQFRAKARAVELLGKGQIADLPTAISELWKNGYDAYGDNLEAFLYLEGYQDFDDALFVLSDDGKGMDTEDILNKWFVLGTDSKSRYEMDVQGIDTLFKPPRVKMGEKGIGRLAVAYLGPQMVMLSKKINHPLQIVFFDWRILENFDLFISDINIPLRSIDTESQFEKAIEELKIEFLDNFNHNPLKDSEDPWRDQQELKKIIISDCNTLTVPKYIIEDVVKPNLNSFANSHWTKFIIYRPDQQLIDIADFTKKNELKDKREDDSGKYTITTLAGLFNLFRKNEQIPNIAFWVNSKEKGSYNILDFAAFFNPDDFNLGDHLIDGTFDEFGTFQGIIRIYNKTIEHSFRPLKKPNVKTNYGPFNIKLGYVAGLKNESSLNDEQYRYFENKLDLYGGLYIYRDGFRVLPYGRAENDFLEFEERRGKSAGDAFFAKRRMFGYIEITRERNRNLKDKSSREGFITNAAFRDFKSDLIAFFLQLAKKYFSTNAEYDYKREQQEEIKKKAAAERHEHERDILARRNFAKQLTSLPKQLNDLEKEFDSYIDKLTIINSNSTVPYSEVKKILNDIEQCKVSLTEYKISKPHRFTPTDLQKKNYHAYEKRYQGLLNKFAAPSSIVESVREKLKVHELFNDFQSKGELYKNTLSSQFLQFESDLEKVFKKIATEFNGEKLDILEEFNSKFTAIIPVATDPVDINRSMKLLENIFTDLREKVRNRIIPYLEHLERLSFDVNEDILVGFYKAQFEEMKSEWNKTYELAQLGIAVEIIDHQFNTLYSQLHDSITSLKNYLVSNKDSETKYRNLSTSFDHLQDNYKLLQPLYRTSGRIRKEISGGELKEYLDDFFKERLNENNIRFEITSNASSWSIFSYESIFKPVLINIINNALYWLQSSEEKIIKMDSVEGRLLIMNSGIQIDDFMLEDIFKLFYSGKPNGRGIGLYLAKQSLHGIGYEIEATNDKKFNQLNGACFSIYNTKDYEF